MAVRTLLPVATLVAGLALLTAPSQQAFAQNARQMTDLVGARASSGQSALQSRGYVYITGHTGNSSKHSYYWNSRSSNCLHVETYDGRFTTITDGTASDCNQHEGMTSGEKTAAAVVGAAILAAAIAHKSGHHEDGNHYNSAADEAQYDRGYNDGLHNASYHNYDRSDAYSSGYQAGVAQRNRNTSYHSGHGGYSRMPRFRDTVGVDAIRGIDMMSEMGFRNVDSISSGNTNYGIFYHPGSRTCVQLTMANSRVLSADDIHTHPNCH